MPPRTHLWAINIHIYPPFHHSWAYRNLTSLAFGDNFNDVLIGLPWPVNTQGQGIVFAYAIEAFLQHRGIFGDGTINTGPRTVLGSFAFAWA